MRDLNSHANMPLPSGNLQEFLSGMPDESSSTEIATYVPQTCTSATGGVKQDNGTKKRGRSDSSLTIESKIVIDIFKNRIRIRHSVNGAPSAPTRRYSLSAKGIAE